jgi:heme A synthase
MAAGRGRARGTGGRRARGGLRAAAPWALWGLVVVAVAGGLVAADRAWLAANRLGAPDGPPPDARTRVVGAVRSISGAESVRRATYDEATKTAEVDAISQYYDAAKPPADNREYLATEGRMAAQLALYENAAVDQVTIRLFSGPVHLATVVARQGQAYEDITVDYLGPLASP